MPDGDLGEGGGLAAVTAGSSQCASEDSDPAREVGPHLGLE